MIVLDIDIFFTMFSVFEWYIMLSYGYPVVSLIHAINKKKEYDAEIIEDRVNEHAQYMRIYVDDSNVEDVLINYNSNVEDAIINYNKNRNTNTNKNNTYIGYLPAWMYIYNTKCHTRYINNMDHINNLINTLANIKNNKNNINYDPYDRVPINLPLKIEYFNIPKNSTLFLSKNTAGFHIDRNSLIKYIMMRKCLPFTFTVPLIASIPLFIAWDVHLKHSSASYYEIEPPTNIWGKIFGNSTDKDEW